MRKTPSEAPPPGEFELRADGAAVGEPAKDRGVMGFGDMPGDGYEVERRRRQQAGADYAARARVAAKLEPRLEALRLADAGLSEREIADRLEISAATAHRWTKTPNEATRKAMAELDAGGGKRFASVDALMAELKGEDTE